MSEDTCPVRVKGRYSDYIFRDCGKPLKTDEQRQAKKCGQHLALEKRREEKMTSAKRRLEVAAESRRQADEVAQRLHEAGVRVTVRGGLIDIARLELSVEDARALLAQQEQKQKQKQEQKQKQKTERT